MAHKPNASPKSLTRRGFLHGTASITAAAMLPHAAYAQAEGEMLVWLPGGSDLFCKIHTGLLDGFAKTETGISASKTVCGLGQNTEFTQALIAAISSGSPPDVSMLWDSGILGRAGGLYASG